MKTFPCPICGDMVSATNRNKTCGRKKCVTARWCVDNKEKNKLINAVWTSKNKEKRREISRRWRLKNLDKAREIARESQRRRNSYGGHAHTMLKKIVIEFLARKNGAVCRYCGTANDITLDHKTPLIKGGSQKIENLQLVCFKCNSSKHTKTHEEFIEWRKKIKEYTDRPPFTPLTEKQYRQLPSQKSKRKIRRHEYYLKNGK